MKRDFFFSFFSRSVWIRENQNPAKEDRIISIEFFLRYFGRCKIVICGGFNGIPLVMLNSYF
jgi:hypothetical protein